MYFSIKKEHENFHSHVRNYSAFLFKRSMTSAKIYIHTVSAVDCCQSGFACLLAFLGIPCMGGTNCLLRRFTPCKQSNHLNMSRHWKHVHWLYLYSFIA